MPQQVATYHFRQKYVSGSYISLDPTDYNDINDIQSEYDSDDDTDVSMIADNDYSVKTQQAAYFKQIQRKKENVKCLSESCNTKLTIV